MHDKVIKMRANIKYQQKGKKSNNQNLVQLDKAIHSGVAILSRGVRAPARRRLATTEAIVVPPSVRCCVLARFFGFNHKIMINV
jgi:hypothetical protein